MADPWVTDSPTAPAEKPLPKTAQPLADEAKDLKALKKAMEDAASVGGTLWVSYISVFFSTWPLRPALSPTRICSSNTA